ncbi:MAG: YebC/PmpR family DNA-binding transcriptional regulator [Elusimicrobiota bacterium]
MSGHSKWAGIKHKKAAIDAKKGKVWTKISREITIAAKLSGGDPDSNPRLRRSVEDARAANMPADNVKRAIQKGTGELPGSVFEELTFEGFGPGGVAIYCEGSTDNRNRTTSEVRHLYEKHGGGLGTSGSVSFLFEHRGYLTVKKSALPEEQLMELVLELGAEDLKSEDPEVYEIFTSPADFDQVKSGLQGKSIETESGEITMIPKTTVQVVKDKVGSLLKLIEALEDNDDIAHVYANFDIPDEILASLEK